MAKTKNEIKTKNDRSNKFQHNILNNRKKKDTKNHNT